MLLVFVLLRILSTEKDKRLAMLIMDSCNFRNKYELVNFLVPSTALTNRWLRVMFLGLHYRMATVAYIR